MYGSVHFGKVAAPIICKNAFPTKGRNCIFAARLLLSGDFQRLGLEVFEIKKESPVFGHSITEHRPQ